MSKKVEEVKFMKLIKKMLWIIKKDKRIMKIIFNKELKKYNVL